MATSKTESTLELALLAAQKAMEPLIKDSKNPHFKNTYASLAVVTEVAIPKLNEHGLHLTSWVDVDSDSAHVLVTRITHAETGEYHDYTYPLICAKQNDPQAFGAAMTYARRYSLMALVGLAPEDDDGNLASNITTPKKPAPKQGVKKVTEEQQRQIVAKAKEEGVSVDDLVARYTGTPKENLTYQEANAIVASTSPGF